MPDQPTVEGSEFLCFFAAGEELALPISRVREIVECGAITWLPGHATAVRGVVSLREKAVPVLDVALRFGLPPTPVGARACIVVLEAEVEGCPLCVGLLAQSVSKVFAIAPDRLQPPPTLGARGGASFVQSMAMSGEKFVLVLDADAVLDGVELGDAAIAELRGETAPLSGALVTTAAPVDA